MAKRKRSRVVIPDGTPSMSWVEMREGVKTQAAGQLSEKHLSMLYGDPRYVTVPVATMHELYEKEIWPKFPARWRRKALKDALPLPKKDCDEHSLITYALLCMFAIDKDDGQYMPAAGISRWNRPGAHSVCFFFDETRTLWILDGMWYWDKARRIKPLGPQVEDIYLWFS